MTAPLPDAVVVVLTREQLADIISCLGGPLPDRKTFTGLQRLELRAMLEEKMEERHGEEV